MNDEVFSLTTRIERPAAEVFAWHERPGAFARLCPPWEVVQVVAATDGIRDGARVAIRTKIGPFQSEWEVEHRDFVAGVQFRDVQVRGPFAKWEHLHRIEPAGTAACTLTDRITYRLPAGNFGRIFGGGVRRRLARVFAWRHATTKTDLERAELLERGSRRVLIAGASGLMGSALVPFLETQGHTVVRLVRRPARNASEHRWDPDRGELDPAAVGQTDAIINLAGENVAAGRWTKARKDRILRSRVESTRTLVAAIRRSGRPPEVLVNASAIGYYGSRGDDVLTEESEPGNDFLSGVCQAWEAEALTAVDLGLRVARLRFGMVLSPASGALAKMLPFFRLGLGGCLGSGRQWVSWVSIDDAISALGHALVCSQVHGALNVCAPQAVRQAEFASVLGQVLRRPAWVPAPAAALQLAFGEMAGATVLASARAVPAALVATGFSFRHAALDTALRHVLGR